DRNHTRRHCGELGHKFADAGAAARDNKAFFGRPHHHIEPILRNIDSDNDRVHLIPPCASGLAVRPKRLFGFDGTAGENPRSPTGLASLGGFGLSPATAPVTLTRAVIRELQGGSDRCCSSAATISSATPSMFRITSLFQKRRTKYPIASKMRVRFASAYVLRACWLPSSSTIR